MPTRKKKSSGIPPVSTRLKSLRERDPWLKPYADHIRRRLRKIDKTHDVLTRNGVSIADFASGHEYFGLHREKDGWVFREWAPNASRIVIIGEMTDWRECESFALSRVEPDGAWEARFPRNAFSHGRLYRLRMYWDGGEGDRIPAYARRVVQDPDTLIFNAQVWCPDTPYQWRVKNFRNQNDRLLIYEAHVGMAQEYEGIGTYREFRENILPRIVRAGYNTIQLMAIQEHPYYGSFGYHVSSFFAASSRFGTPEDLKELIDAAHEAGIAVIMDIIHSHAVSNEVEGLSRFDGTLHQYFHDNPRGLHTAWDSRCFDYGKIEVLHFLLSNCRFWLDEYRVDGFRFDGITSMLYLDHGLGKAFTGYDDYFGENVDEDALTCLALANRLVHAVRPEAVTIAEDISGMPGLASSETNGGFGFDFRFAMGVPDYWIKLTKDTRDEDWPMAHIWHELNNRRADEKTISYAESHDQALVGDQTLIFRMIGAAMYEHMHVRDTDPAVDRGMALHKMIRLITLATAADGYLNFMGNEFGHPEWIDFPRSANNWSYWYARRQWRLADNPDLKYHQLASFDRAMIELAGKNVLLGPPGPRRMHEHNDDKILAFQRRNLIFVFNFHPVRSCTDYRIEALPGRYEMILDSDAPEFGGHGRLAPRQVHFTLPERENGFVRHFLSLYIPCRSAFVLEMESSG